MYLVVCTTSQGGAKRKVLVHQSCAYANDAQLIRHTHECVTKKYKRLDYWACNLTPLLRKAVKTCCPYFTLGGIWRCFQATARCLFHGCAAIDFFHHEVVVCVYTRIGRNFHRFSCCTSEQFAWNECGMWETLPTTHRGTLVFVCHSNRKIGKRVVLLPFMSPHSLAH